MPNYKLSVFLRQLFYTIFIHFHFRDNILTHAPHFLRFIRFVRFCSFLFALDFVNHIVSSTHIRYVEWQTWILRLSWALHVYYNHNNNNCMNTNCMHTNIECSLLNLPALYLMMKFFCCVSSIHFNGWKYYYVVRWT